MDFKVSVYHYNDNNTMNYTDCRSSFSPGILFFCYWILCWFFSSYFLSLPPEVFFSFKSIFQFFHYWVVILRYFFKFCEFILLKSNLQCNSISSFLKNASAASGSSHFLVMFPALIINMRGNRVLWSLMGFFSSCGKMDFI